MTALRTFRSHKTVQAAKILEWWTAPAGICARINATGKEELVILPSSRLQEMQDAKLKGDLGYAVVYTDTFRSWSPSKAFEDGYTEMAGRGRDPQAVVQLTTFDGQLLEARAELEANLVAGMNVKQKRFYENDTYVRLLETTIAAVTARYKD